MQLFTEKAPAVSFSLWSFLRLLEFQEHHFTLTGKQKEDNPTAKADKTPHLTGARLQDGLWRSFICCTMLTARMSHC